MIPASKYPPSLDYRATGPFYCTTQRTGGWVFECETLAEAITEFVRYSLPPEQSRGVAGVMDGYGVIVVAYDYQFPKTNDEKAFEWTGTAEGVAALTAHSLVDSMLAIDIEAILA